MKQEIERLKEKNMMYEEERAVDKTAKGREEIETSVSVEDSTESPSVNSSAFHRMGIIEASHLIPKFNPSNKNTLTACDWLQNIENLMKVYAWDEKATMLYAIFRLEGAARYWYESKQTNINSWSNFKTEFTKAFPTQKDETSIIFQIMTRKRRRDECVENYFYSVAALAKKINLKEETTIKYIISGLGDSSLINMLLAANCQHLTELLVHIKRYEEIECQERQREILNRSDKAGCSKELRANWSSWKNAKRGRQHPYENTVHREGTSTNKDAISKPQQRSNARNETNKGGSQKCFRCGEVGHFAITCRASPNHRACYICRKVGHIAKDCPAKKMSTIEAKNVIVLQTEMNTTLLFKVNGRE